MSTSLAHVTFASALGAAACGPPGPVYYQADPDAMERPDGAVTIGDGGEIIRPFCGGHSGDFCDRLPEVPVTSGNTTQPPDLACGPPVITFSDHEITVSGVARDFQSDQPLNGAQIAAFFDLDLGSPEASATASVSGGFSLILPVGAPNRMNWRTRKTPDYLDTYAISVPIDIAANAITQDRRAVSRLTVNAVAQIVGVQPDPNEGIVVGTVTDCDGEPIRHAVAVVSTTSQDDANGPTKVPGSRTFYFDGGDPSLPAPENEQRDTNVDGMFVTIDVPPGSGYFVQAWGFLDAADVAEGADGLQLLGEVESPSLAGSILAITMPPTEGPL